MKYLVVVLAVATIALAEKSKPWGHHKNGTIAYTTITTTALTTYCPEPTKITHNGKTYTVTEATTLTITDCPCTVTEPVHSALNPSTVLYTSCPPADTGKPAPSKSEKSKPVETHTYSHPLTVVHSHPTNGATTTGAHSSKPSEFSGSANANKIGGLIVGAVAGVVAFAL